MKEANITINANTAAAAENLKKLGESADISSKQMMGLSQVAMTVAETISGSFAIATGAAGLLAGENERLQQIAVKANSAIALAIGIRQLAEQRANVTSLAGKVISIASATATKLAAKAQGLFTMSIFGSAKAFKVMKAAIVSTGIGALVVMLGMIIEKLMTMADKSDEAAAAQERLNEAVAAAKGEEERRLVLMEQLARADTEAQKSLIRKKLLYGDERKAIIQSAESVAHLTTQVIQLEELKLQYEQRGGPLGRKWARQAQEELDVLQAQLAEQQALYDSQSSGLSALNDEIVNLEDSTKQTGSTTKNTTIPLTELEIEHYENKIKLLKELTAGTKEEKEVRIAILKDEVEALEASVESAKEGSKEKFDAEVKLQNKRLELQKAQIVEVVEFDSAATEKRIALIEQLTNAQISEFEFTKTNLQNEIDLMQEKIDNEELPEQKRFELKEQIAQKELELAKMVTDKEIEDQQAITDAKFAMASATANIFGSIAGLMKEGTAAQKAAGLAEIAINTGVGFMQGLSLAQKAADDLPGPAAMIAMPIFYASQIAAVLGAAAQAKAILQSGGTGGAGGGGGITYTAPYVPEGAAQDTGGAPQTTEGGGTVQAYVVSTQMTNQQALDEELELQSTL